MYLVSVIMNCHNGEKFLRQSINSLLSQSYKNWELIFFDNVSKDKSIKIAKGFNDKRIKIYKTLKYMKLYSARNAALKKTKGKIICFLDTDDLWKKNKLKEQLKIFHKKKRKVVYSNYLIRNQIKKKEYIFEKKLLPSGFITQNLLNKNIIGIHTSMISKEIFKKIRFNSSYEIIGDYDFFLKLSLTEKIFSIQKPLAIYRHHTSNFSLKTNVFLNELVRWKKENKKMFKKFNFNRFTFQIIKMKVKQFKIFN